MSLGKGQYKVKLTSEAEEKVNASRHLIDQIVKDNRVVYGITTGFGKFARTVIEKGRVDTNDFKSIIIISEKLRELQENLIRSHAAGVGKALTPEKTRMLLALRYLTVMLSVDEDTIEGSMYWPRVILEYL